MADSTITVKIVAGRKHVSGWSAWSAPATAGLSAEPQRGGTLTSMSVFARHIQATVVALNWRRAEVIERGVWESRSTAVGARDGHLSLVPGQGLPRRRLDTSPSSWPDCVSCGSAPAALRNQPSTALAPTGRPLRSKGARDLG